MSERSGAMRFVRFLTGVLLLVVFNIAVATPAGAVNEDLGPCIFKINNIHESHGSPGKLDQKTEVACAPGPERISWIAMTSTFYQCQESTVPEAFCTQIDEAPGYFPAPVPGEDYGPVQVNDDYPGTAFYVVKVRAQICLGDKILTGEFLSEWAYVEVPSGGNEGLRLAVNRIP